MQECFTHGRCVPCVTTRNMAQHQQHVSSFTALQSITIQASCQAAALSSSGVFVINVSPLCFCYLFNLQNAPGFSRADLQQTGIHLMFQFGFEWRASSECFQNKWCPCQYQSCPPPSLFFTNAETLWQILESRVIRVMCETCDCLNNCQSADQRYSAGCDWQDRMWKQPESEDQTRQKLLKIWFYFSTKKAASLFVLARTIYIYHFCHVLRR